MCVNIFVDCEIRGSIYVCAFSIRYPNDMIESGAKRIYSTSELGLIVEGSVLALKKLAAPAEVLLCTTNRTFNKYVNNNMVKVWSSNNWREVSGDDVIRNVDSWMDFYVQDRKHTVKAINYYLLKDRFCKGAVSREIKTTIDRYLGEHAT